MIEYTTYTCSDKTAENIIKCCLEGADRKKTRNNEKERLEHDKKLHKANIALLRQKQFSGALVTHEDYERSESTINNLEQQIEEINRNIAKINTQGRKEA